MKNPNCTHGTQVRLIHNRVNDTSQETIFVDAPYEVIDEFSEEDCEYAKKKIKQQYQKSQKEQSVESTSSRASRSSAKKKKTKAATEKYIAAQTANWKYGWKLCSIPCTHVHHNVNVMFQLSFWFIILCCVPAIYFSLCCCYIDGLLSLSKDDGMCFRDVEITIQL